MIDLRNRLNGVAGYRRDFVRRWCGVARGALALTMAGSLALPLAAAPAQAQQVGTQFQQNQPTRVSPLQATPVTIETIAENPATFYGQAVTVTGEIGDILGPRSFTVESSDLLFDEDIPVVATGPLVNDLGQPLDVNELTDRRVRVTGIVHQFNLLAFEDQLGLDLDDPVWQEFAGQPAIIATSIQEVVPNVGPITAEQVPGLAAGTNILNVTVDDIAENPAAYIGSVVAVTGEVEEALGPRSFAIEDNDLLFDEQVLVVGTRPFAPRGVGPLDLNTLVDQNVLVVGTVRTFNVADFENQLGVDLDDQLFQDWIGRPAILALSVRPLDTAAAPGFGRPAVQPGLGGAVQPGLNGTGVVEPGLAESPGNVTVDDITENPALYYGQQVTVSGEVGDTFETTIPGVAVGAPQVFTIEDSDIFFDEDVLVVSPTGIAGLNGAPTSLGTLGEVNLLVNGVVRPFNLVEFERELGVDLDDALFSDWEGRPAIIADRVIQSDIE